MKRQLRRRLWLWCNNDSGAINVAGFGDLGGHTECLMAAIGCSSSSEQFRQCLCSGYSSNSDGHGDCSKYDGCFAEVVKNERMKERTKRWDVDPMMRYQNGEGERVDSEKTKSTAFINSIHL